MSGLTGGMTTATGTSTMPWSVAYTIPSAVLPWMNAQPVRTLNALMFGLTVKVILANITIHSGATVVIMTMPAALLSTFVMFAIALLMPALTATGSIPMATTARITVQHQMPSACFAATTTPLSAPPGTNAAHVVAGIHELTPTRKTLMATAESSGCQM